MSHRGCGSRKTGSAGAAGSRFAVSRSDALPFAPRIAKTAKRLQATHGGSGAFSHSHPLDSIGKNSAQKRAADGGIRG